MWHKSEGEKKGDPESYFGRGRCDLLNASRSILIALTAGAAGLKKCKKESRCLRVKSSFIKVDLHLRSVQSSTII